jgi:hypothetical protein
MLWHRNNNHEYNLFTIFLFLSLLQYGRRFYIATYFQELGILLLKVDNLYIFINSINFTTWEKHQERTNLEKSTTRKPRCISQIMEMKKNLFET